MQRFKSIAWFLLAGTLASAGMGAAAATPAEIQKTLEATARASAAGFNAFSAERGKQFFNTAHGNDWSCASCHSANPAASGKHAKTGKEIAPLAPAANPQRFSDAAKTEKWFDRNCKDVLGRVCTAQEKGDVLVYLMSIAK